MITVSGMNEGGHEERKRVAAPGAVAAHEGRFVRGVAVAVHIMIPEIDEHFFKIRRCFRGGLPGGLGILLQPGLLHIHLVHGPHVIRHGDARESVQIAVGRGESLLELRHILKPLDGVGHIALLHQIVQRNEYRAAVKRDIRGIEIPAVDIWIAFARQRNIQLGFSFRRWHGDPVDMHVGKLFIPLGGIIGVEILHGGQLLGPDGELDSFLAEREADVAQHLRRCGQRQAQRQSQKQGYDSFHGSSSFILIALSARRISIDFRGPRHPFTAPSITPFTKYRCTKGYSSSTGSDDTIITAYFIKFCMA